MEFPPAAWAAATAFVGGLIGLVTSRGKDRADVASALTASAMAVVNELQEEVTRLRDRLTEVEREVRDCEDRYDELRRRIDMN